MAVGGLPAGSHPLVRITVDPRLRVREAWRPYGCQASSFWTSEAALQALAG